MGKGHESIINFTPMFCSGPSRKGMVRKCNESTLSYHQNRAGHLKTDVPASPKVSCMGYVRGEKVSLSGTKSSRSFFQIKKIFAGKSMGCATMNVDSAVTISTIAMDPPLPVTNCENKDRDKVSLWTRRCGYQLEGLQLQRRPSF